MSKKKVCDRCQIEIKITDTNAMHLDCSLIFNDNFKEEYDLCDTCAIFIREKIGENTK